MRQKTLADEGFERFRKPTRRDQFLAEMEAVIPWAELCNVIKPFYPQPKGAGRPPVGLERMLRVHFLQHDCVAVLVKELNRLWFNSTPFMRHPIGLGRPRHLAIRIALHVARRWFNLSDPACSGRSAV